VKSQKPASVRIPAETDNILKMLNFNEGAIYEGVSRAQKIPVMMKCGDLVGLEAITDPQPE
jgi:hypothetical protein